VLEYLKQYITEILDGGDKRGEIRGAPVVVAGELLKEPDRFDPRDFEPAVRADLLRVRTRLAHQMKATEALSPRSGGDRGSLHNTLQRLLPVLDHYRGEGSWGGTRSFPRISDPELRDIIERDYRELAIVLFPAGAWKSCVVMAGSILEAILLDLLTQDRAHVAQAMASLKAPKKGQKGPVKDITKDSPDEAWTLANLIGVAGDLGLLPAMDVKAIHQVLRDYRNFVHPRKEKKAAHPCTEAEAMLAKGALDAVCNHLFPKSLR
jgi:hypothetical protein